MQICLTEEGIQIDESDEQSENARPSIHESLESDSNLTVERDLHSLKQDSQIFSTEEGIQMPTGGTTNPVSQRLSLLSTTTPEIEIKRRDSPFQKQEAFLGATFTNRPHI
jgi:hypothetical protein